MTNLEKKIEEILPELVEIMKDFHRHPELGFEEHYTAERVAGLLRKWGYEVTEGIGGTGVMGVMGGALPGPTLALRACLDALEITEQTGVDYASENPGKMHACGHDGNMTVTLGAARILARYREGLKGNLKFIFQPSEENTGGAIKMVEAGCLKNPDVDAIITPHIWHEVPKCCIGMKPGHVMASGDLFTLKVHGTAGHGAWPHLCVDPLPVAAELILALQKIISREVDPMTPACLTIGKVEYGAAANIVADTVTLYGAVRTFDSGMRAFIEKRIEEIADGVTRSSRASYSLEY
ncbi:MAG: M20 metallopeptidase family protein, partial [Aminivibrio sp.]